MEQFLYEHPVFSLETLRLAFSTEKRGALYKRLRHQELKGRVISVLRGVYAVVPPGTNPASFSPDRFLTLSAMRPDAVFCGRSAFDLYGASNQVWRLTSCYSHGAPVSASAKGCEFVTFKTPHWVDTSVLRTIDYRGIQLRVTSPELTVVEGFKYPGRVGGIEEFLAVADALPRLDPLRFPKILSRIAVRKLYSCVGWFLARAPERYEAPEEVLEGLHVGGLTSPKYLVPAISGGMLDRTWNLIIPNTLASKELLSEF